MRCTNCGGPLPEGHGCRDKSRKHSFCDACAGLAAALAIGAREPAFLYESTQDGPIAGLKAVTTWTGAVVGYCYSRTAPPRHRLAPVRFKVHMLDGSRWYGTGPSSNGTYMRLRPLKGP